MSKTLKLLFGATFIAAFAFLLAGADVQLPGTGNQANAVASAAETNTKPRFRSRPGLKSAEMKIHKRDPRTSKEPLFIGSKDAGAGIYGADGELIWFRNGRIMDFRTQTYRKRPVLTWFQAPTKGSGLKKNTYMIANRKYEVIKKVYPGRGLSADSHEFRLTRRNTAFVTSYKARRRDLSAVGMGSNAPVSDSIAQEIDIRTGKVLWQWRSLDHVPIEDTYAERLRRPGAPFDYFHINSVADTPDGNVMISGRSTNAIYKVNKRTGRIMWTLGGKSSDFKMLGDSYFSAQHDAQSISNTRISLFDNAFSPVISTPDRDQSRGLILDLDMDRMEAKVNREFHNPAEPLASTQANVQKTDSGNFLVGWGGVPLVSEHAPNGELLFNARMDGFSSFYRAYRNSWNGLAPGRVALKASHTSAGKTKAWISWNGDSKVRTWRFMGGKSKGSLAAVGRRDRDGFETAVTLDGKHRYLRVIGLSASGKQLGVSQVKRITG